MQMCYIVKRQAEMMMGSAWWKIKEVKGTLLLNQVLHLNSLLSLCFLFDQYTLISILWNITQSLSKFTQLRSEDNQFLCLLHLKVKAMLHWRWWYGARHSLLWKLCSKQVVSQLEVKSSSTQGDHGRVCSDEMRRRRWLYKICIALSCWIIYALPFHLKLFAARAVNASFVKANETVWCVMTKSC